MTSRDLKDYPTELSRISDVQYLEVGAGLGEFIPFAAEQVCVKPVVIDPANYHLMRRMLREALDFNLSYVIKDRINVVLKRCNTILDPSKVVLFNWTMEEALIKHPELNGIADVVVENWGPTLYDNSLDERVYSSIKKFAKPSGRVILG